MTVCALPVPVGEIELSADGLTDLSIDCTTGFVATELQVGFPAPRAVVRPRALGDGMIDNSQFLGPRAITLSLTLDTTVGTPQSLIDRVMPFMLQTRRPRLAWRLGDTVNTGSFVDNRWRSAVVRGTDAPLVITGPRYLTVVLSFITIGSFLETKDANLTGVLARDPAQTIVNSGTAPAPWTFTFTGNAITPQLLINGISVSMPAYTVPATDIATVDVLNRTITSTTILPGGPITNLYPQTNSYSWSWDALWLQPGNNTFRYVTGLPIPANVGQLSFRDAWL